MFYQELMPLNITEFIEYFKSILPADYANSKDGLVHHGKDRKGEVQSKIISKTPLAVLAIEQSVKNKKSAVVFAGIGLDGKCVTARVDMADVAGRGIVSKLCDLGLPGVLSDKELYHFVIESGKQLGHHSYYSSETGWVTIGDKLEAFVLPTQVIALDNSTKITYHNQLSTGQAGYKRSGLLEDWLKYVAEPLRGNPLLIFSLLVGLFGPLMKFFKSEGFLVHFYGRSSSGKSTALKISASIWGPGCIGHDGFVNTWRATTNSLELLGVLHNDTVLIMDELKVFHGMLGDIIYFFVDGKGKSSMKQDRSSRENYNWNVPILSTGEQSIFDAMEAEGETVMDGQKVRCFNIPITPENFIQNTQGLDPAEYVRTLKERVAKYYGCAGPAFVYNILESISENCDEFIDNIESEKDSAKKRLLDGKPVNDLVERAADKFAMLICTGLAACNCRPTRILPYTNDEIYEAGKAAFDIWRKSVKLEADELNENRRILNKFINAIWRKEKYIFGNHKTSQAFYNAELKAICIPKEEFFMLFPNKGSRSFLINDLNKAKELHRQKEADNKYRNIIRIQSPFAKDRIACYIVQSKKDL